MTSDIVLRQGWRPGDLGAVVRLHGQVYAEHGLDQRFEAFVARELGALATGESAGKLWLADSGDATVVGSVALQQPRPGTGRLRFFVVAPQTAGQGVGRRLLNEALAHAAASRLEVVDLWTFAGLDAAAHLYTQAGFRLAEERRGETWGKALLEQRYELQLGPR